MATDTPLSLCAALRKALNLRVDVQKGDARPSGVSPGHYLVVTATMRSGVAYERETGVQKLLDDDRPIGDILAGWFGPEARVEGKRDKNWHLSRAEAFGPSPANAIKAKANRTPRPPAQPHREADGLPPPPEHPAGDNPQAPGSRLDWPDGREPNAAPAVVADPVHAGERDTYQDPVTNERRPKLSRRDMVKLGMTREQRHEQYKRQGGPHPDEA